MKPRSEARHIALKVLYQIELVETPIDDAFKTALEEVSDRDGRKEEFARELVKNVLEKAAHLDDELRPYVTADWDYDRLGILERCILKIAAFEIASLEAIPCRVTIDEAVELGKTYIGPDAGRLINGILHRFATEKDPSGLTQESKS